MTDHNQLLPEDFNFQFAKMDRSLALSDSTLQAIERSVH